MCRKLYFAVLIVLISLAGAAKDKTPSLEAAKKAWNKGKASEAIKMLEALSDSGNHEAQYVLGNLYLMGEGGIARDGHKALELLERSAKSGYQPAEFAAGICYLLNEGVPQDASKALEWFKLAASHGDQDAARMVEKVSKSLVGDTGKAVHNGGAGSLPHDLTPAMNPEVGSSALVAPYKIIVESKDSAYAYTPSQPVLLAGLSDFGGVAQEKYFKSLRGPKGEIINYRRMGSCCSFNTDASPVGVGLIDVYELTYEGLDKLLIVYVNSYQKGDVLVPKGLKAGPSE